MRVATVLMFVCASICFAQPKSSTAAAQRSRKDTTAPSVGTLLETVRRGAPRDSVIAARRELARLYQRQSDWWNAIEQLEALRKLTPDDPEATYQLGVAYNALSSWAFQRMQSLAPNAGRSQQLLAEQYSLSGENDLAEKAYRQAIKAAPALEGSHLGLAMLYLRMGKQAEAAAEVEQELAISPESAAAEQLRRSMAANRR